MPIIEKHKLIFQHVPKTAGISICNFFGVDVHGHHHLNFYCEKLGNEKYAEYKTFSIIRNPINRFVSAWNMYRDPPEHVKNNKLLQNVRKRYSSFFDNDINDFITYDNLKKLCEDTDSFHFWSVLSFYCSNTAIKENSAIVEFNENALKNVQVNPPDIVLNFHKLNDDLELMSRAFGFEFDVLKKLNHRPYNTSLSKRSAGLLHEFFQYDFRLIEWLLDNKHISKYASNL